MRILAGLLAFGGPLAVYVASAKGSVGFGDAAEFQTVLYVLGIAHTPGYPLFTLVGWFFTHLVPFGEVAWRVTLLCAIAVAVSCWLLFRTIDEICDAPWIALAGALVFAFGNIVWARATITDPHVFGLAFDVLFLWSIIRWYRRGHLRDFYISAVAAGLAAATQLTIVFLLLGTAILADTRLRSLSIKRVAIAVALAAIGPVMYLYLPLRSAVITRTHADPISALGIPSGGAIWDNGHPASWNNFISVISAGHFHGTSALWGLFKVTSYPHYAAGFFEVLRTQYSWVTLLLALAGLLILIRRDSVLGIALALCAWLPVPFPFELQALGDPPRYFLVPLWVVALLVAVAAAGIASSLGKKFPRVPLAPLVPLALFALSGFELYHNDALFFQRNDRSAVEYTDFMLQHTPDNAIIVTWWNYSCPLNYALNVEHRVGQRIIVNGLPEEYSQYYDTWLRQRPLYISNIGNLKLKHQRVMLVSLRMALYRVLPLRSGATTR